MTQHGAQNGLAASEQHLLQLIRQFADVINHETDYLARVESELKSSISERRAEIDKQRRIKLTELSNRATAESIAAKENIHDLARKLGLNPQSGVPQFLYLGDSGGVIADFIFNPFIPDLVDAVNDISGFMV